MPRSWENVNPHYWLETLKMRDATGHETLEKYGTGTGPLRNEKIYNYY